MRKLTIVFLLSLLLGLSIVHFSDAAEQVYVKSDAVITERNAGVVFTVTNQIKTDVLKLRIITETTIKYEVKGVSNRREARQVIEEMTDEGTILTEQARYEELFPAPNLGFIN